MKCVLQKSVSLSKDRRIYFFTELLIFKLIKFMVEIIGYIIYNNLEYRNLCESERTLCFFQEI